MGLKLRLPQGLRHFLRRAADTLPPTVRGLSVAVAASYALWRWGYGEMDLLVFVVSLSGLALFVLACLLVCLAAVYLSRHLEAPDTSIPRLETGSPIPTGFSTPSLAAIPLVKIDWHWSSPAGMECRQEMRGGRTREVVVARQRTLVSEIERVISVHDAFGLCRITWRRTSPTALQALPHRGRLGNLPPVTSLSSAEGLPHPSGAPEGDRMEVRRYVPGDSVRLILWKTWARTGQLNVRVPERAVDPSERTIAYLLAAPGDEATAAAARVALEQGLLGQSWLFAADGSPEPTDDMETALAAICRSSLYIDGEPPRGVRTASPLAAPGPEPDATGKGVDHGPRPTPSVDAAAGLRRFLAHPKVRGEVHCVVFAAGRPGPWVDAALAATRSYSGAVSFVLGTDGVLTAEPSPFWHRLLFFDSEEDPTTTHHELQGLTARLEKSGHPVLVVDRSSGRSHGRLDPRGAHGQRSIA